MQNIISKILVDSFYNNKSVNFVVKQDSKKENRIKTLMDYSIFMGVEFGKVYLTDDHKSCAIILYPERKKVTIKSLLWDVKLLTKTIGFTNIGKVLKREKLLKKYAPKAQFVHLWYIGVDINAQGKGLGSLLLQQIKKEHPNQTLYLETSNERNLAFYEKNGFKLRDTIDKELGYTLYTYILERK